MEAEMLCKATEELSDWLSPFLVVSITFNIIGLMALVYFLYQVMAHPRDRVSPELIFFSEEDWCWRW